MTDRRKIPPAGKKAQSKSGGEGLFEADFERVEFHRHGLALFPDPGDRRPGIAIFADDGTSGMRQRFCSCSVSAGRTCPHILKLSKVAKALTERLEGKTPEEDFRASIWHRLAEIMSDGGGERPFLI